MVHYCRNTSKERVDDTLSSTVLFHEAHLEVERI